MHKGTLLINGISVRLPHICKECKVELLPDGSNFSTRIVKGRRYYRIFCRPCFSKYTPRVRKKANTEEFKAYRRRQKLLTKKGGIRRRLQGNNVFSDARNSDKKKGRGNDLDREFVHFMIQKPCTYCGAEKDCEAKHIRMGLDRIDNSLGHLKSNVVPCCSRCNLTRGNMPHKAWLVVAEGMRKAFEQNLFGDWTPGNKFIGKSDSGSLRPSEG